MKMQIIITLTDGDPIMDVIKTLGGRGAPPPADAVAEIDGVTVEMSNRPQTEPVAEPVAEPRNAITPPPPEPRNAITPPPPEPTPPEPTPPEPTPPEPTQTVNPAELDADGEPWDPELHSPNKTKTKAGAWRKRRGAQASPRDGFAEDAPDDPIQQTLPQGPCNEGQFATAVREHRDRWGHAETQKALLEIAGVDHPAKVKPEQFETVRDGLASWSGGAIDLEEFL